MKTTAILTAVLLFAAPAFANSDFQTLGLKNSETLKLTDEDLRQIEDAKLEEYHQRMLELSDPQTRAAILKAQEEQEARRAAAADPGPPAY